jgi:hypothetical protein
MIRNQQPTGGRTRRNYWIHRRRFPYVDGGHGQPAGRVTLANFNRAVSSDPAAWLKPPKRFAYDVASLIPATFPRFARVFHPATRREGGGEVDVSWADVAAAGGRTMHPAAEWGSLTGSWQIKAVPGRWGWSAGDRLPTATCGRSAWRASRDRHGPR